MSNSYKTINKVLLIFILAAAMTVSFCACGSQQDSEENQATAVVFFSRTGNTEAVANKIAKATQADIYNLKAAEPYSEEDVSYGEDTRAAIEQADPTARPEIEGGALDLSGYDTVYIGYPIWYSDAPKLMYTFVEGQDFSGKTVIPFCTSDNTGIKESCNNLKNAAGSGNWNDGKRFGPNPSKDKIKGWLKDIE